MESLVLSSGSAKQDFNPNQTEVIIPPRNVCLEFSDQYQWGNLPERPFLHWKDDEVLYFLLNPFPLLPLKVLYLNLKFIDWTCLYIPTTFNNNSKKSIITTQTRGKIIQTAEIPTTTGPKYHFLCITEFSDHKSCLWNIWWICLVLVEWKYHKPEQKWGDKL